MIKKEVRIRKKGFYCQMKKAHETRMGSATCYPSSSSFSLRWWWLAGKHPLPPLTPPPANTLLKISPDPIHLSPLSSQFPIWVSLFPSKFSSFSWFRSAQWYPLFRTMRAGKGSQEEDEYEEEEFGSSKKQGTSSAPNANKGTFLIFIGKKKHVCVIISHSYVNVRFNYEVFLLKFMFEWI